MTKPSGRTAVVAYRNYSSTVARNKFHTPKQSGKARTSADYGNSGSPAQLTLGENRFHQRIAAFRAYRFYNRTYNASHRINNYTDTQKHTGYTQD